MKRIATFFALLLATSAFAQKQTPPAPGTPKPFNIPEIRKLELPNGLRVRFVPYGAVPKVTIRLVVQTGNADESLSETWLADLMGTLMEQGTTTRSAEQISREIALMGGALDISVGPNQTTIGTDVFSESAVSAVALVADVARNPRLPESELARLRALVDQQATALELDDASGRLLPRYARTFAQEARCR